MTTLVSRTDDTEAAEARCSANNASAKAPNDASPMKTGVHPSSARSRSVPPQRHDREVGEGRQGEDDDEVRQRVGVVDSARVGKRVARDTGSDRELEPDAGRAPPPEAPHQHDPCGDKEDSQRFARRGPDERRHADQEDEHRRDRRGRPRTTPSSARP